MALVSEIGGLWADTLDPIVKFNFDLGLRRRPSMLPMLFNMQKSARAYEDISGIGAISPDSWDIYETGRNQAVPEADFDQGYKKRYTHVEKPLDLGIEHKLLADGNFAEIARIPMRLGDSASVKRELDGASVFNNAFSGSFLGSDGVALCSNSHPLSPMKTGVTQDNNHTLALTKDNVATVRESMMAFTDDNNVKMAVTPKWLLVPPDLEDEAIVISKSLLDPTSASNAVNPQQGRFQVVVWHYLTDVNAWFMIDPELMKFSLDWFDREALTIKPREGDDRTLKAYWRCMMRYSFGFNSWQWIAGSNPS